MSFTRHKNTESLMETLKVLKTRFHFNNVDGYIKTFGKQRNPEEVM